MLNIISRSIVSKHTRGPKKVVSNLIEGLDRIGYPYVINYAPRATERLWVHDDAKALEHAIRNTNASTIAGPNIYVLPRHIPESLDLSKTIYLTPAPWTHAFWKELGYSKSPLEIWPIGVDTDTFTPSISTKKYFLIYIKQRSEKDVRFVENHLFSKSIPFKTIQYGSYTETEYMEALKESHGVVWLGRSESQGMALLEALSMNVPVLVCDIEKFGDWVGSDKDIYTEKELLFNQATSAPYFDNRCGIILKDLKNFSSTFEDFGNSLETYTPRDYILENLTLEKQAKDFINLYETYFDLSYEEGLKEKLQSTKKWRNAQFSYKVGVYIKDNIKILLNKLPL